MPLYQFHCDQCGADIEEMRGVEDRFRVPVCECGLGMRRVWSAARAIYKGQGWTRERWRPNAKGKY